MMRAVPWLILAAILCWPTPVRYARASDRGGTIVATGNTVERRFSHTATLLPSGKVLIAGGMAQNGVFNPTAEIYDPSTQHFTSAGRMISQRAFGSTAALLPNGKVLIAGGSSAQCGTACYLRTAEIYDPVSGKFTATGDMTQARAVIVSAVLRNGDLLVVGGSEPPDSAPFATAELYHPDSGSFSPTGRMQASRDVLAAATLRSGKVLVIGRTSGRGDVIHQATAEIYDPATGKFSATGKMKVPRTKLGAALMEDGRVLVAGGQTGGAFGEKLSTTEIYDPATGTFSPGPEMSFKRFKLPHAVVALPNGRILVAGGAERPEVFDPATRKFLRAGGATLDGYSFSSATLLANGEVLIVGGYAWPPNGAVNHAWLYHP
jgi:Kelch motif